MNAVQRWANPRAGFKPGFVSNLAQTAVTEVKRNVPVGQKTWLESSPPGLDLSIPALHP